MNSVGGTMEIRNLDLGWGGLHGYVYLSKLVKGCAFYSMQIYLNKNMKKLIITHSAYVSF